MGQQWEEEQGWPLRHSADLALSPLHASTGEAVGQAAPAQAVQLLPTLGASHRVVAPPTP